VLTKTCLWLARIVQSRPGSQEKDKIHPGKNTSISAMMSSAFMLLVALVAVLAVSFKSVHGAGPGASGSSERRGKGGQQKSRVVPPSLKVPYGRLSIDWWRWAFSIPDFTFTSSDSCTGNQIYTLPDKTPVFFLAGIGYPNEPAEPINIVRKNGCNVPKGAYLMIPAVNGLSALNPNGTEDLGDGTNTTSTTEYLLKFDNTKNLTKYSLSVDEELITTTGERILSDVEPFDAPNINVVNGRAQGLGIWNVLSPLPKGRHVVRACTTLDLTDNIPGVIQFCVMYHLTVLDH
jgi:hypothetical protein